MTSIPDSSGIPDVFPLEERQAIYRLSTPGATCGTFAKANSRTKSWPGLSKRRIKALR